jgi:hypothetical protein
MIDSEAQPPGPASGAETMTDTEKAVIEAALEWTQERLRDSVLVTAHANVLVERCVRLLNERAGTPICIHVNPEPGHTKLTSAQRAFWRDLCLDEIRSDIGGRCYRNTTQLRRLLPFVRANAYLIEELPRTPRGGWGYKLKDGVDPSKVVIP